MPLDAMAPTRLGLDELLAAYGIKPVPMQVLEQHKAERLRLAHASFLLTWKPWAIAATTAVLAGIWLGSVFLTIGFLTIAYTLVIIINVICGSFMRLVRQGRWLEYRDVRHWVAPKPISGIAYDLKACLPDGVLILGKLVQDEVVLDPYLLFEWHGEQVCLGIWDTGLLIHAETE